MSCAGDCLTWSQTVCRCLTDDSLTSTQVFSSAALSVMLAFFCLRRRLTPYLSRLFLVTDTGRSIVPVRRTGRQWLELYEVLYPFDSIQRRHRKLAPYRLPLTGWDSKSPGKAVSLLHEVTKGSRVTVTFTRKWSVIVWRSHRRKQSYCHTFTRKGSGIVRRSHQRKQSYCHTWLTGLKAPTN